MRLDEFLTKNLGIKSRSRAKRAIELGLVKVNDRVIKKPAYDVKYGDNVTLQRELAEKSAGYFKLREIQAKTNLIKRSDVVLDIGSSAGGFLLYASENASMVYGIEYSREFYEELKAIEREKKNVRVLFQDIFKADLKAFIREELSLILNDLALDWRSSLKALSLALPLLGKNGRVLQVVKFERDLKPILKELEKMGLKHLQTIEGGKREKFLIAIKID
jgi:23S rRNA (cytidine1920-2'-O)/16S rRNA (cytidine1409-2'-O)-methyltransferase